MLKSITKLFFKYLIVLLGVISVCSAQNTLLIDSLNRTLSEVKSDEEKIEILNELSWQYSPVNFEDAKKKLPISLFDFP